MNTLRVLQRISTVFSRNRVNIEKLNVFETKSKGVSHFDIVIKTDEKTAIKVMKQLRKVVEVHDVKVEKKIALIEQEPLSNKRGML